MSNEVENTIFEDDGTLACLHLSADRARKRFNCPDELQSNLVGKTFWVIDFFDNVPSKYSQDRYLFQIKFEKDAPDSEARKIKDARALALLDEIIDSAPGLPIGNYLSQTFANIYLAAFDHYVKEVLKVKHYFRYVDDIVVLSGSKEELRRYLAQIRAQLADLHLTVKDNWQIFPVEVRGIDFLGFVFRHGYVLLRKRIKQRIFKALRRLRNSRLSIKARRMAVGSYIGWLKYTNSKHLIQTFNSFSYVSIF